MVTSHHAEVAPGLGELASLYVFHPRSEDSDGDLVFLLARHRAGVTADTSILVDNEPVAHKRTTYCTEGGGFWQHRRWQMRFAHRWLIAVLRIAHASLL
jgi:hypothetical protein